MQFTLLPFALCLLILLAGCDETFNPITERESHPYSIFGLLEYPADTNWIRVSEVRNNLYLDENATIDAVVTLQHMESGQTETLQDTLVQYEEGIYAFNFRSSMVLEPEQPYLLKAEREDGQTSSAMVRLPPMFPEPVYRIRSAFPRVIVEASISGIEYLAEVNVIYHVRNESTGHIRRFVFHHIQYVSEQSPGEYLAMIYPWTHANTIKQYYEQFEQSYTILYRQLYVASASDNWIDFPTLDPQVKELPDIGNVENGNGYLVGITSQIFAMPCDFCEQED
ncbi:MAG: DUF4249 family protein [Balneolaceae bacterium]|nr:DUF4249 family protein [Balneolaceae bacterium]